MPLPPGYVDEQPQQQPPAAAGNLPAGYQLETPDSGTPTFYAQGTAPKSTAGFLGNAVTSTGKFLKNAATAIVHPIDTVSGLAHVAAGGMNTLTGDSDRTNLAYANGLDQVAQASPAQRAQVYASILPALRKAGLTADEAPDQYPGDDWLAHVQESHADDQKFAGLAQMMKQRYGSVDKVKETLYNDPVGMLADMAGALGVGSELLGAGGEVADAAKLGKTAQVLNAAGDAAGTLSKVTNPAYLPTKAGSAAFDAIRKAIADRLYMGALKPTSALPLDRMKDVSQMGLELGLNPTSESDLAKLQEGLANLRQEIDAGVQTRTAAGALVDPIEVAKRVDDVIRDFKTVNPQADQKMIAKVRQNFLDQFTPPAPQASGLVGPNGQPVPAPPAPGPRMIPLDEAQDIKVNTDKKLSGEYGNLGTAEVETEKALNRGMKEEIEKLFPEIEDMNMTQGIGADLSDAMEAAVKRHMKDPLVPGAGDLNLSVVKKLLTPAVRAKIAIALEKVPQFAPSTGMTVAQRVALVNSRLKELLDAPAAATAH